MTVLHGNTTTGFDLRQLGRVLGVAALIAVLAAGIVLAFTNEAPSVSSAAAQVEAARADIIHIQNKPAESGFSGGGPAVRGRAPVAVAPIDRADLKFAAQGEALSDPADAKFKD